MVFSTKVNLLYLLYSLAWRCYLLHLIKQNCLLKAFLITVILMTAMSWLLVCPSRTNLKLHNISITPKMIKKVIINLDDFNAGKTHLVTLVLLMWKWTGLFLREHLLRCWGWLSLVNWTKALTLSQLLKVSPRKLEPWFVLD